MVRDERSTCTNFWATIGRICDYYGSCKSHRLVSPFKRHTIGVPTNPPRTYDAVYYRNTNLIQTIPHKTIIVWYILPVFKYLRGFCAPSGDDDLAHQKSLATSGPQANHLGTFFLALMRKDTIQSRLPRLKSLDSTQRAAVLEPVSVYPTMHLEQLPLKILLLIVEYLGSKEDLDSFTRVSKYIRNNSNTILYKKHGELALLWAGEKGIAETAQFALRWYNFEEADANRKRELCERAFLLACDGGYIDLVKMLLEQGVLATYKNYEGMSGLSLAAGKGHNDIVEMLVKAGADPSSEDKGDKSPLMLAAIGGHQHTVNILLDSGAAIDSLCHHESATALMFAAYHGHENIVNILLDRGANIDKTDNFGNTALWHAIWGCQKGAFQTLVQRGANTSLRDIAGKTYLESAEYYRGIDWVAEKRELIR
ncbi:hypothetical protein DTO280E4_1133 [Paecilomyces variotii]|nr:hypothetical protein DTO280E4_1133 [Paecilomyces variotii]